MKKMYSAYIIDDDPIFILLFKKIIAKSNRFEEVHNFHDGQFAIERLQKLNDIEHIMPDFIFLDLNMPNIDGWQFLDEVEKLEFKHELNIYIITSSIDNFEIEKAKKYKFVKQFISKPLSLDFFEKYNLLD